MNDNQNKHLKNLEKANKAKEFLTKNSHKLDLIVGIVLLVYGVYGYITDDKYFYIPLILSLVSFIMVFVKPVKKFDNYINNKIIKK
jgi:hypothetical protein